MDWELTSRLLVITLYTAAFAVVLIQSQAHVESWGMVPLWPGVY